MEPEDRFPFGYAWITFNKDDSIKKVLDQKDHFLHGYKIEVQLHEEHRNSAEEDYRQRNSEEDNM
ncbi:unnamed protein product [Staurois parvus]|uniref:RRM domain-containing protein n=1 Tax=Staurois parvus TaxID=386267 RepID=A0ABN9D6N4_9NEOB|nr:unnamed protein product [Staurois parvus]